MQVLSESKTARQLSDTVWSRVTDSCRPWWVGKLQVVPCRTQHSWCFLKALNDQAVIYVIDVMCSGALCGGIYLQVTEGGRYSSVKLLTAHKYFVWYLSCNWTCYCVLSYIQAALVSCSTFSACCALFPEVCDRRDYCSDWNSLPRLCWNRECVALFFILCCRLLYWCRFSSLDQENAAKSSVMSIISEILYYRIWAIFFHALISS